MFSQGSYAKIWGIKKSSYGDYYEVSLSTSRKNGDGEYETDFSDNFVRFVGKAKEKVPTIQENDKIRIEKCGVTTFYNKEKKIKYTNYVVFDFEMGDGTPSSSVKRTKQNDEKESTQTVEETDNDYELPF